MDNLAKGFLRFVAPVPSSDSIYMIHGNTGYMIDTRMMQVSRERDFEKDFDMRLTNQN